MDFAIGFLDFLVKIFPSMEDAAEFGKIGRDYAAESMLVLWVALLSSVVNAMLHISIRVGFFW